MIANRSAAMSKSPSAFTELMLGDEGTTKCLPGGYACLHIFDSYSSVNRRETMRAWPLGGAVYTCDVRRVEERSFEDKWPTNRKISPFGADLEEPKPPDLVEVGIEELRVIVGAEALIPSNYQYTFWLELCEVHIHPRQHHQGKARHNSKMCKWISELCDSMSTRE